MKIRILIKPDEIWKNLYFPLYRLIKDQKWKWQSVGALVGLCGGFSAPFIGTLLNLIDWLSAAGSPSRSPLYKISMVFYILTLPLLIFGSHCLDLLEKKAAVSAEKEL